MNRYSYARNNPLKYIDPTGHYNDEDTDPSGSNGDVDNTSDGDDGSLSDGGASTDKSEENQQTSTPLNKLSYEDIIELQEQLKEAINTRSQLLEKYNDWLDLKTSPKITNETSRARLEKQVDITKGLIDLFESHYNDLEKAYIDKAEDELSEDY